MSNNPDFFIAEGDTLPNLDAALFGGDQVEPVELTGSTVEFKMWQLGGTVEVLARAATLLDATEGRVRHAWQAGDTDTPGVYLGRFVVTYPSGDTQTFPNDRHIKIHIS